MYNESFHNFYEEYLGLKNKTIYNGVSVSICKYRDIPLNKQYYYKVIATQYKNENIISCASDFSECEIKDFCNNINFKNIATGNIQDNIKIRDCEVSCMYRMLLNDHKDMEDIKFTDKCGDKEVEFRYIESYKKIVALIDSQLVGYCKISDIISKHGNIVVWVEEAYRRLGIAEKLVKLIVYQCNVDCLVPMYIVKFDNYASIALAEKIGFQIVQKELVFSYKSLEEG